MDEVDGTAGKALGSHPSGCSRGRRRAKHRSGDVAGGLDPRQYPP